VSGKDWIASHKRRQEEKREKRRQKYSPGYTTYAATVPESRDLLCPLDLSDDMVAVSVSVFKTQVRLIERAVGSILNGSHRNVRVVVTSDGDGRSYREKMSKEIADDPRLVELSSPENHGPYFNHDVVLRATSAPFFAVQDSDDVSHHTRLAKQLETLHTMRAEAVHSPIYECDQRGRKRVARCNAAPPDHWGHRADHFGVYARAVLLALGGYHAGFRMGYDTNLTAFINLLAKTTVTKQPLYTRHRHHGSLTSDSKTGCGSKEREDAKVDLKKMWGMAAKAYRTSRRAAVEEIRSFAVTRAAKHGSRKLRDDLVAELRKKLDAVELVRPPLGREHLERLVNACHREKREQLLVKKAYRLLEAVRPPKVTVLGAVGVTPVVVYGHRFAADACCREPDSRLLSASAKALAEVGLGHAVIEQRADVSADPGVLVMLGDGPPLATVGPLVPGTEVWLPERRLAEQQAELPARNVASDEGLLRVTIGS